MWCMDKMKNVMKKWWVTVLVFALALSLTSCSKKKKEQLQSNFGYRVCDDSRDVGDMQTPSLGSFDVYLQKSTSNPGMYELFLYVVQPATSGDIVAFTVSSSQTGGYKTMVPEIVLDGPEQEISVGYLSAQEVQLYDVLAITPAQPGVSFAEQSSSQANFCYIPQIGENNQPGDYTSTPQY